MSRCAVVTLLVTAARLAAQDTPLDAFRANIAAIHARDRAAYLSRYLHTPALARVGPDGLRQGYDDFARGTGAGWPDTLVATHLRIVPVSPDVAYGVYRYPYEQVEAELHATPERFYRSYLCSGVTAVFDVGGYPWTLELQERTARSTTAPRVVAAGPLLSTIDFWLNLPDQRQFIYMSDETAVRAAVRAHKAWGAAAVKVWYIMPPQPPDTARVSALVHAAGDEARKVGLPLIVHATGLWEAKDAMQAGARVLVHSVWSGPVDDEFLALARRGGTIYVPTLTVPDGYRQVAARRFERALQPLECGEPANRAKALATDTVAPAQRPSAAAVAERSARTARTLAQGLANLKRVHDAGIPVGLGTDAGNPLTLHGASVFAELEAMQAAGLKPVDVLLAATRTAARAAGAALDSAGTLTAGAVADLVVLDADPLPDIRNVRRIALVARSGEIYTRRQLGAEPREQDAGIGTVARPLDRCLQ